MSETTDVTTREVTAITKKVDSNAIFANWFADVANDSIDNFDGTEKHKLKLQMLCEGVADWDADSLPNGQIEAKYMYAAKCEVEQDDGELVAATRVILIDKDYHTLKFCSVGVAKSMATIMMAVERGAVKFPLKLRLVKGKTRKGRTIYNLGLVD